MKNLEKGLEVSLGDLSFKKELYNNFHSAKEVAKPYLGDKLLWKALNQPDKSKTLKYTLFGAVVFLKYTAIGATTFLVAKGIYNTGFFNYVLRKLFVE